MRKSSTAKEAAEKLKTIVAFANTAGGALLVGVEDRSRHVRGVADDAIAEQERQQGRAFSEQEKAVFRKRGEHRFQIPDGSRWGDVKAASINLGAVLTKAMRAVANANDELRGVFTVDWNQPAPDGSGKPLIPNEVVHALVQHFDEHGLSNRSVPSDV